MSTRCNEMLSHRFKLNLLVPIQMEVELGRFVLSTCLAHTGLFVKDKNGGNEENSLSSDGQNQS